MMKKETKILVVEFVFLFSLHYSISFLLKGYVFKDQLFNSKIQLIETFIFSIIMVFIFKGINHWRKLWKK